MNRIAQLFGEKDKIFRIEQNNSRKRNWFARHQRKTLVNLRSIEMVDITMLIFAAIHVNKTLKIDHTIFG